MGAANLQRFNKKEIFNYGTANAFYNTLDRKMIYIVDLFCYYGITKLQINGIDYNILKRKELTEK